MKLKELFENLDKSQENKDWISNEILNAVGICGDFNPEECPELECFWGLRWLCTDTHVGVRFYFLEGNLVCASYKQGRKSDEIFFFESEESYDKLRKYLLSKLDNDKTYMKTLDWDAEIYY
jgi:hypothetical protein